MIAFNPDTRTFNLLLKSSYYAFQVDAHGRVVHLGWGPRPADAGPDEAVSGAGAPDHETPWSFMTQFRPEEILAFGDVTAYHVTLKASFPSAAQPVLPTEAEHLPIRDLRLRYKRHEVVTDAQPGLAPAHGLPVRNAQPRETLRVVLHDQTQPFRVTLCYRLTPELDMLERWSELENLGPEPVTLEVCYFASLHLPIGANELTYVSGDWAGEMNIQRQRLPYGVQLLESRSLQTSHKTNPFFLLNRPGQAGEEAGTVYFGQLAYSGSWQMAFEQLPTGHLRVHGGYNPFDDQIDLAAGRIHRTPAFVCGLSQAGWGGASRQMHAFALERVLPCPPEGPRFRPVLYNSWEATTFNLSYESQAALARQAAALGVELFCVDDGWFGARSNDLAGLGDWVVRPSAFPNGLEPLVQEVHRLGMKFGLWVEPEMVNPDSELYRQHPDWVLHFPGRPRTEARHQLILDFGRPEVVAYILASLEALVARYAVAFFKWDMNRLASEPGSVAGKGVWRAHAAAVYHIMDRLRQKFPSLEIQSCSGGGGRMDLGILGRVDQVWTSDNTDPYDRLLIQEGASLAYPARVMENWVTAEHNGFTGRSTPLSLRFEVAMRGTLGIGTALNELSEAELAEYARYIAFYKRIRHVVQRGALYRLERLEENQASVVEYVLPNGQEAVYSLALRDKRAGRVRPPAPLRGLISGAVYAALDRDQHVSHRATGYELMTLGLPQDVLEQAGTSLTLHVKDTRLR
jgi:alpha-galactosidase